MKKGFTLIELIIVVAIIGMVAAIAMPAFKAAMAPKMTFEGGVKNIGVKWSFGDEIYRYCDKDYGNLVYVYREKGIAVVEGGCRPDRVEE